MMHTLDFERPLADIEAKISALSAQPEPVAEEELASLRKAHQQTLRKLYSNLSAWETVRVARHPKRPQFRDYVSLICKDFCELHGDRRFGDDPAIVTGFARIGPIKCLLVGHHKGRDTSEKIRCHFGCAHPEGYRKALLKMKLAAKFGLPIVTFVDTPGAYPGLGAEQRGQAEAIAVNLLEMSRLETQIVSVVIGEGGSGGAVALAAANRVLMFEHAVYSVISPEGCASILWKSASKAEEAADTLAITATRLKALGLVDKIINEPLGGAHRDYEATMANVKKALTDALKQAQSKPTGELLQERFNRLMGYGKFKEIELS